MHFPDDLEERYAPAVEQLRNQIATFEPEDLPEFLRNALTLPEPGDAWSAWCTHAAAHYLDRLRDAQEVASHEHLAQIGLSVVEHVGSLIQAEAGDELKRECALLTIVVESFAIDPNTPTDAILLFRHRNAASIGRLRAALSDLAHGLRQDASPHATLEAARDTFRNRVAPALGDLEDAMKESMIPFIVRSTFGGSTIALGPVAPIAAVEHGAQIAANALNYRFARKKLVREHPFGYLYRIQEELGGAAVRSTMESVRAASESSSLTELFLQQDPSLVVDALLGGELELMPRISGDW